MKINGYMITKNGKSGFIDVAIESLARICDNIYVSDNGSDDGTYNWLKNNPDVDKVIRDLGPYRRKAHMIRKRVYNKLVEECGGDWIIGLDDDEQLVEPGRTKVMLEESLDKAPLAACHFYHIWKEDKYRVDGNWKPGNVDRILMVNRTHPATKEWIGKGSHCSRIPMTQPPKGVSGIPLIHYGWKYKDEDKWKRRLERKKKWDEKRFGKGNIKPTQKATYDAINHEPKLKKIPDKWQEQLVDRYKDDQKNALQPEDL